MNQIKINYQKELEQIIEANQKDNKIPTLFLHSCCAPCSSYCLEYLAEYFDITLFYYNPNISPKIEYEKRVNEQKRLIEALNKKVKIPIKIVIGNYDPERFYDTVKGMENLPEGGKRCYRCYELRLMEAGVYAKAGNFDFFTTTLSISPLKNAQKLNEIGSEIASKLEISYLPSDFKKKNGYKRSIELSKEYDLYRQNYCGCIYSKTN
ncbi:MAG: epoxyqueuosine reductase QueH [Velocimicrobium sp.]